MNPAAQKQPAAIALEEVSKAYGDTMVLKSLNLHIRAGEFVTVVGRSGSGKTTLLRLLNGLVAPSQGIVRIRGTNIAEMDRVRLRRTIGYAIQGAALFPHMRVRENIGYVLALLKTDAARATQRVEELLDVVRLEQALLERYPHELSGGQKQRAGIARALAAKPDILLMDEPFGALDEITRRALQEEMKRIHRQLRVSVVFVTHDVSEALSLGSAVLVMNGGRIEQFDAPEIVARHPATPFVAALMGTERTAGATER